MIDPILENPTLPEVPDNKGPLTYGEVSGVNDIDTSYKNKEGV